MMRKFDHPKPLALACLLSVLGVPAAHAATHTVCQTAPATFFDIQDAIDDAGTVNGDVIDVCAGAHTEAGIFVTKDLTFRGQGQGVTFVQADTTPGTASDRVFEVDDGRIVDFEDMTIRHGNDVVRGGGINIHDNAVVTLTRTTVSDNTAGNGGGVWVDYRSTLTIESCTVSNNSTPGGRGGGISVSAENVVILISSTVSGNSARNGGGLANNEDTHLLLVDTTVSGNSAANRGGGIYVDDRSFLTLDASTVSGNSATDGGGIYVDVFVSEIDLANSTVSNNSATGDGGGIYSEGIAILTNVTLAENVAVSGGGIFTDPRAVVTLSNNVIAGNSGGDCDLTDPATIPAGAPNLDSDGTCAGFTLQNAAADLGVLADNGGATFTHALGTASDALDAGDNAICAAAPVGGVDQRGVARPQGSSCDLGAFEREDPATLALELIALVEGLGLPGGLENALVGKLEGAIMKIEQGNSNAAAGMLDAFINQVNAQRGKKISDSDADLLIAFANAIIASLP